MQSVKGAQYIMQEILSQITDHAQIRLLLDTFTPYLTTLATGQISKDQLSKKFATYGIVLTLSMQESITGFAAFYCNDTTRKQAFLSLLAVLPEYRRNKIGQKLLNAVISHACQAGMDTLTLEVQKNNLSAIHFYLKNNFSFMDTETAHSRFMILPLH